MRISDWSSDVCSSDLLVELLGNLPAECLPGERVSYSMLVAHSVLAAMCLKVDGRGRRFAQMLHDDVFSPLGMTDTNLGVRDDLLLRLCPVRVANQTPVYPFHREPFAEHVLPAPGGEIPSPGGLT